ncbi:MAG: TatD family hydrolase [Sciscionella sp.]
MGSKSDRGVPPPVPEPLPVSIVDAHTHLDACGATDPADVSTVLDRASSVGVRAVVTVADDMESARWVVRASTWDNRVYAAVALHPTRTATFSEADRAEIAVLAAQPRVVAVGETGLDYYWDYSPPAAQRDAFRWHIGLAKRLDKPLMIHDREAHDDILSILDEEGAPERVVFHSFSGDRDMARRCVDAGYVLSFSGTITFRNARAVREAARFVPAEHIQVETDAPFLTPHPYRGRPNQPYGVAYTVRGLAELRGVTISELLSSIDATTERLFRLRGVTDVGRPGGPTAPVEA